MGRFQQMEVNCVLRREGAVALPSQSAAPVLPVSREQASAPQPLCPQPKTYRST